MKNLTSLKNLYSIHTLAPIGGGSGVVKPPITDNLIAHYAELVNSGINKKDLTDGDVITQWDDLSGNDLHLASTNSPVYNEALQSIKLNGTNQYLRNATGIQLSNEMTIFLVATPATTTASYVISDETSGFAILSKFDNGGIQDFEVYGKVQRSSLVASTTTDPHILSFSVSNTKHLQYGKADREPNIYNEVDATFDGNQLLKIIGNSSTTGSNWYGGDVLELLVYDYAMTDSEILQIENYLSSKYSLTLWTPTVFPEAGLISYYTLNKSGYDELYINNLIDQCTFVNGKIDNAAQFTNVTDRISATDNTILEFEYTDEFSFSLWFKLDDVVGNKFILSKGIAASPYSGYSLYIDSTFKIKFDLINDLTTNALRVSHNTTVEANKWYFITISYDGSNSATGLKMYVNTLNDNTVISDNLSATIKTDSIFNIGNRNNGSEAIKGIIDEVGIWNRALEYKDMYSIYNFSSGMTYSYTGDAIFPETDLLAYYKFDDDATDQCGYADLTETDVIYDIAIINNGVSLINSTSKLETSDSTLFDFQIDSKYSIGFWLKRNEVLNEDNFIMFKFDSVNGVGYMIKINSNTLTIQIYTDNGYESYLTRFDSDIIAELDVYHYYTLTYDGTTYRLFIDSVEIDKAVESGSITLSLTNSINLLIGTTENQNILKGDLDEFGIWNRVLYPEEIETLYNEGNGMTYEGAGFEPTLELITEITDLPSTKTLNYCISENGIFLVINNQIYKWNGSTYIKLNTIASTGSASFYGDYILILVAGTYGRKYEYNFDTDIFDETYSSNWYFSRSAAAVFCNNLTGICQSLWRTVTTSSGFPSIDLRIDASNMGRKTIYSYQVEEENEPTQHYHNSNMPGIENDFSGGKELTIFQYREDGYDSVYVYEYDPVANTITRTTDIVDSSRDPGDNLIFSPTGKYLIGMPYNGQLQIRINNGSNNFSTIHKYVGSGYYSTYMTAAFLNDDYIVIVGRKTSSTSLSKIELININTDEIVELIDNISLDTYATTTSLVANNTNIFHILSDDQTKVYVYKTNKKFNIQTTNRINYNNFKLNSIFNDNSLTLEEKIEKVYNWIVDYIQAGNYTEEELNNLIDFLQDKKDGLSQTNIDRINDIIQMLVDALV